MLGDPALAERLCREDIIRLGEELKQSGKKVKKVSPKPFRISDAIDNTLGWKEDLWTTTAKDFGAIKPSGEFFHEHHLSSAKHFDPNHPHWKNPIEADYKGLKSTYQDLGQKLEPQFKNHNVTQEFMYL
jgi:hypothetical protein